MTNEQAIAGSIARLREADNEAHASRVAFAAGRFNEHMAAKVAAIEKRLESEYDAIINTDGGSQQTPSGGGTGPFPGGEGGGDSGSPTNAREARAEG